MFSSILYSLNSGLNWLLSLKPSYSILIISVFTVLLSTVAYKYLSNQNLIKQIKSRIKSLNAEIKQYKSDMQKSLELQNQILKHNMEMMPLTMKPSMWTLVPMLLVFLWVSAVFSQQPIIAGSMFSVSVIDMNKANDVNYYYYTINNSFSRFEYQGINTTEKGFDMVFKAPSQEGKYDYSMNGKNYSLIVSSKPLYFDRKISAKDFTANIVTEKLIVLNLFGWKLGYIGTYILYSIFVSMIVRKILDVD